MKKILTILTAVILIDACFAGCGTQATNKSEVIISNEEQLNSVEMAESNQIQSTVKETATPDATASEAKDAETSSLVERVSSETEGENINTATVPGSQVTFNDSPNTQTTKATPEEEVPKTFTGTFITSTFIITKVNGTHLELNKLVGDDVEKLTYSCDLGNFDGSSDMNYKVGDYIVLRYDQEIEETYPLRLTVREIYPPEWNN